MFMDMDPRTTMLVQKGGFQGTLDAAAPASPDLKQLNTR